MKWTLTKWPRIRVLKYAMTSIALVLGVAVYLKLAQVFFNLLSYYQHGARYYVAPGWFGTELSVSPLAPMLQRADLLATWGLCHVLASGTWLLVLLGTDAWKLVARHAARCSKCGKGSIEW